MGPFSEEGDERALIDGEDIDSQKAHNASIKKSVVDRLAKLFPSALNGGRVSHCFLVEYVPTNYDLFGLFKLHSCTQFRGQVAERSKVSLTKLQLHPHDSLDY